MQRYLFLLISLFILATCYAQKKNFTYKFYGQVRGDLFYNSRANAETVDGLFHLYPKDHVYDPNGKDLNSTPNGSFYVLYTRLGLDITGPKLGNAETSLKIEADFRGSGSTYGLIRIRQAYINLDWGKSDVTIGQTWHPLFGNVSPQILNLNTGAPFQPFNRSPLLRYRYKNKSWETTVAAIWQLQYLSAGPNGKSEEYIKNSCTPEIYAGVNYKTSKWLAGAGIEILSLTPRVQNTIENKIYKVSERITTFSPEAHFKYTGNDWMIAGKTLLASNLTQCSMLGGYGVTSIIPQTGEQEYTPFRNSASWLNIVYGGKWKPGIFLGYIKNLGTTQEIAGPTYGVGVDVAQLITANAELTYNLPHWKAGLEYSCSTAYYGTMDNTSGKINDTHAITNHRILGVIIYFF